MLVSFVAVIGVLFLSFIWSRHQALEALSQAKKRPATVDRAWLEGPDSDGYFRLNLNIHGRRRQAMVEGKLSSLNRIASDLRAAGVLVADERN